MELKAGLVCVSLELLPFWRTRGVHTPEAEGIVKSTRLSSYPAQKQAGRLSMAADVHAQRWTWGIRVDTIHSPSTLSALKKEDKSRGQEHAESRGKTSPITHPLPTQSPLPLSKDTYLHPACLGSFPRMSTHLPVEKRGMGEADVERPLEHRPLGKPTE